MRLADDDEVYEVDSSYLGPPGRYIAVMRHKTIFLWLTIAPMVGVLLRKLGMHFNLLTVGLTLLGVTALVLWLADRITYERPWGSQIATLWHEVNGRRRPRNTERARAADLRVVGSPRGPLKAWTERRAAQEMDAGS